MKIEEYKQAARTLNRFVLETYLFRAGVLLKQQIRENNEMCERLKPFLKGKEVKVLGNKRYGPPPILSMLEDFLTEREMKQTWEKIQERLNQKWPPVHPVCGLRRLSDKK